MQIKTCCEHAQITPYCAYCGKPIQAEDPLLELLNYCRKQLSKRIKANANPDSYLHCSDDCVKKWQRWTDALEAAKE